MGRRPSDKVRVRASACIAATAAALSVACAGVEGLDQYALCETDCAQGVDSSVPPADGPPGDEGSSMLKEGGDAIDGASSGPDDARPDSAEGVDSGDAHAPTDGGIPGDASCGCVGAAPSGWSGYVQLVLSDAGVPQCPAPYDQPRGSHKTAPTGSAAQCTPCTCGTPPSGPIQCQVSLGSGGALCAGETMTVAPASLCVLPPGPMGLTSGPNGDSYGPTTVPAPVGACAPDGGRLAQPLGAAQWASVAVCAGAVDAGGACPASGDVCLPVPRGAQGSPSGVCIYQSGVQTCPSGGYSMRVVAGDAFVDSRGCGACGCATPACPADGYVEGYTSLNCSGTPAATLDASTPCVLGQNANGSASFKYIPSHSAWAGTCAVSAAGGPDGGVSLDDSTATTFCCMP